MAFLHRWILVLLVVPFGCDAGSAMHSSDPNAGAGPNTDSAGMIPCKALKPLADRPVLGPWHAQQVYYSPDRSWLLLHVQGNPERLLRVALPSGDITTVADRLTSVRPLANGGPFLLTGTGSGGDDTLVYDGKEVRKIWTGECRSQASADGTRLYVIGACVGEENGLVGIDVATGGTNTADQRAVRATTWHIAVSPSGQWAAYTTGDHDVDNRTIAVANAAGDAYTIASVSGVVSLQFISDDLLVFHTGGEVGYYHGDIRGHVPGSGDTSFLVASDFYAGPDYPYYGYQLSPDRTRVLAAKIPMVSDTTVKTSIYSVPLHGGEPLLLVSDWVQPGSYITNPFYFDSQGKYVIYLSPLDRVAQTYTTWMVDMQGSPPRKLVDGWASPTPATSSVVFDDTAADGRYRLRLTDLATLRDRLSYVASHQIITAVAFRGDQAILFGEYDRPTLKVRFMSVSRPRPTLLGAWIIDDCRGCESMAPRPDPTGCFTVLNTDAASGPGARLVLLPD